MNTCIEAGIALGANRSREAHSTEPIAVFLTARYVSGQRNRVQQLPFMFQDDQITWYLDEAELMAHCRRLLQPYRRRVMNYEFGTV